MRGLRSGAAPALPCPSAMQNVYLVEIRWPGLSASTCTLILGALAGARCGTLNSVTGVGAGGAGWDCAHAASAAQASAAVKKRIFMERSSLVCRRGRVYRLVPGC